MLHVPSDCVVIVTRAEEHFSVLLWGSLNFVGSKGITECSRAVLWLFFLESYFAVFCWGGRQRIGLQLLTASICRNNWQPFFSSEEHRACSCSSLLSSTVVELQLIQRTVPEQMSQARTVLSKSFETLYLCLWRRWPSSLGAMGALFSFRGSKWLLPSLPH